MKAVGVLLMVALVLEPRGRALAGQATIRGKLAIKDRGGKLATDVADGVVWLEGAKTVRPVQAEIVTKNKAMVPGIVVVAPGSTVSFPNLDPFNHNVFSVSPEASFDLGSYGRGSARSASFQKPGVVRVYCNVHAQMGAVVLVLETSWVARPSTDGSWQIDNVPPGSYTLVAWHERGGRFSERIEVTRSGSAPVAVSLDATGFTARPHLNKFGKSYDNDGRRY
jgi:plastocyanin